MAHYTFQAELKNLRAMIDVIHKFAEEHGFGGPSLHQLEIAAEEALVNIIFHGYKNVDKGDIELIVEAPEKDWIRLVIKDKAMPFNPLKKQTDLQEARPLETRRPGGLGIFLFKEMVDSSEYRHSGQYNILTLAKKMRS